MAKTLRTSRLRFRFRDLIKKKTCISLQIWLVWPDSRQWRDQEQTHELCRGRRCGVQVGTISFSLGNKTSLTEFRHQMRSVCVPLPKWSPKDHNLMHLMLFDVISKSCFDKFQLISDGPTDRRKDTPSYRHGRKHLEMMVLPN